MKSFKDLVKEDEGMSGPPTNNMGQGQIDVTPAWNPNRRKRNLSALNLQRLLDISKNKRKQTE